MLYSPLNSDVNFSCAHACVTPLFRTPCRRVDALDRASGNPADAGPAGMAVRQHLLGDDHPCDTSSRRQHRNGSAARHAICHFPPPLRHRACRSKTCGNDRSVRHQAARRHRSAKRRSNCLRPAVHRRQTARRRLRRRRIRPRNHTEKSAATRSQHPAGRAKPDLVAARCSQTLMEY